MHIYNKSHGLQAPADQRSHSGEWPGTLSHIEDIPADNAAASLLVVYARESLRQPVRGLVK